MSSRQATITMSDHRLVTEEVVADTFRRLKAIQKGEGMLRLTMQAWWEGRIRWARNRVTMSGDQRDLTINLELSHKYGVGRVTINQIDQESITAAMHAMERQRDIKQYSWMGSEQYYHKEALDLMPEWLPYPDTAVWSEATFSATPEQRARIAQSLTREAESQGMLSAGDIAMRVLERYKKNERAEDKSRLVVVPHETRGTGTQREARIGEAYQRRCMSECSMTVRHPKGTASGWAGLSSYDWSVIDAPKLATIALDKCIKSLNPVAIEPGRYTAILEPQAVHGLVSLLVRAVVSRQDTEDKRFPKSMSMDIDPSLGLRMTKLGLKIVDERITISHDPLDPRLGILTALGLRPATWIKDGVLQSLGHGRGYAVRNLQENLPDIGRSSYIMSGGTTSMDEMIETTKRGVLVTRFSGVRDVPGAGLSLLQTGLTRDGLWLIENGKIVKAVKNMRFTDSPLFFLNQIQQLGVPVPVLSGISPAVVPPIKVNDFAFTATIDAI